MRHNDFNRAIRRYSCERRNPDKHGTQMKQVRRRPGQARKGKLYIDFAKYNNERGLTLLEIIITFIVAIFVGSMLVEYMGTSLTRGGEGVIMVQDGFSVNSIMEKITADYEDEYKTGSYDLSAFKSNIEGGNVSTNSPYYGDYTVITGYISFDAGGTEIVDTSGNHNLLKVIVTVENQSLTALFRR